MNGTSEGPAPMTATPSARCRHAVTDRGEPERADYRGAFAHAPLPLAVVDGEGLVVDANDAFAALLGAPPEELAGRVAADLVDLASDARTWHSYREVLRGRRAELRVRGA
ncbi:EAL domain-containing protein OS=Streptomyces alboniger OX=132473 GN=CP975_12660 PE=4 SV=1 [Streptomyces alboniger]